MKMTLFSSSANSSVADLSFGGYSIAFTPEGSILYIRCRGASTV
jgi:hypothetical protein